MPETVASVRLVAPGSSRVATLAPVVSPFQALGKRTLERFANAKFDPRSGKMTASLAAAASLALSIMVVSFAQTLLVTFSKPVSDQRESLLGFETLVVGARMTQ